MVVYGIAWVIFDVKKSTGGDGDSTELNESDSGKFRVSWLLACIKCEYFSIIIAEFQACTYYINGAKQSEIILCDKSQLWNRIYFLPKSTYLLA